MTGIVDAAWADAWLRAAAAVISEHRKELNDLDRAIGDGDHGENLDRGFAAIVEKLDESPLFTPGAYFKLAAMTLMSKVGGAAGPLYGTAYLRAATTCGDAKEIDGAKLAEALAAARDGVVARGKAEVGDKTMIDAWTPAVDAAAEAAGNGAGAAEVLKAAAQSAQTGAESTDPLVARKGRASYLAERSAGHRDPGAVSSALLLQAAVDALEQTGTGNGGTDKA
ncbi:dihydroxyacetone kinase subunit DhaL [Arthrobacter monumenti]